MCSTLTSPLDSDAGEKLVTTESQSVTGDYSDVHLWIEENVVELIKSAGLLAGQGLRGLTGSANRAMCPIL